MCADVLGSSHLGVIQWFRSGSNSGGLLGEVGGVVDWRTINLRSAAMKKGGGGRKGGC